MNAERLADLRHEQPQTRQSDIAKVLGVSTSTYSLYEQGLREPDDATKIKIAHFFGVSVDYLIGNSDSRTAQPICSLDAGLSALRHQLRDASITPTYHGRALTPTARQGLASLVDGVKATADALIELSDQPE